MLRSRIIPVLLISDGGLVKTKKFQEDRYLGDPLNAVRVFNEFEVDEITVLDISNGLIDFDLVHSIVKQCRMPLSYGGKIRTINDALKLYSIGVEKLVFRTLFLEKSNVFLNLAQQVGRQSIAVCLDVQRKGLVKKDYFVCDEFGKTIDSLSIFLEKVRNLDVGEVIINNRELDGTRSGMDFKLIEFVRRMVPNTPLTFIGGIKDHKEIVSLASKYSPVGIGVGSAFVYKGKLDGILLSYLSKRDMDSIRLNARFNQTDQ